MLVGGGGDIDGNGVEFCFVIVVLSQASLLLFSVSTVTVVPLKLTARRV